MTFLSSPRYASALAIAACSLLPIHCFAQQAANPNAARPALPVPVEVLETQTLTGTVTRFTQAPTGGVDGFELDGGTTVHYPPYLAQKVTSAVAKNNLVRVTGLSGGGPGTGAKPVKVVEAQTITNLTTNQTLDLGKLLLQTPPTPSTEPPAGVSRPSDVPKSGPAPPIPGAR